MTIAGISLLPNRWSSFFRSIRISFSAPSVLSLIHICGRNYGTGHFRKTVDIRSTASNGLVLSLIHISCTASIYPDGLLAWNKRQSWFQEHYHMPVSYTHLECSFSWQMFRLWLIMPTILRRFDRTLQRWLLTISLRASTHRSVDSISLSLIHICNCFALWFVRSHCVHKVFF